MTRTEIVHAVAAAVALAVLIPAFAVVVMARATWTR